jgi:hypothetical protein
MFFSQKKFKGRIFAFTPDVNLLKFANNKTNLFQEHGIAFVVINESEKEVSGIRLLTDGNENFDCSVADFESMIERKVISEIEKLPKFVLTSFKKQYQSNLNSVKNGV